MLMIINTLALWLFSGKYKYVKSVKGARVYLCVCPEEKARLHRAETYAFTFGEHIYVRERRYLKGRVLKHELEHVKQERTVPLFPFRYWVANWQHGYLKNPYEVAARRAERR